MAFPASALAVVTFVDVFDTTQLALDLDLETHKIALFTNSVTGADLTTDTAYGSGAWGSNEVPNGSGYATGGIAITGTTFLHGSGGTIAWDANDPTWAGATFTARGGLYYADALAGNNIIVAKTFGADIVASGGSFVVQEHSSGIYTIDVVP